MPESRGNNSPRDRYTASGLLPEGPEYYSRQHRPGAPPWASESRCAATRKRPSTTAPFPIPVPIPRRPRPDIVTANDHRIARSADATESDYTASGGTASDGLGPSEGALDRALAIVEFLRANCPWDRAQTAESLIPYLIEESQEVVDAIRSEDARELEGELGDLLLNVAFQIVLAEEAEAFDRNGVVDRLEAKMKRRHPQLFGEGERENWEALKARELPGGESVLSGLPAGLDPLLRAHRIQEKLSGVGFDWEDAEGARLKVAEELEEVRAALDGGDPREVMDEAGDLLFTAVNLARLAGVHASNALARTNQKVEARFRRVEELARDGGRRVAEMSLEELDALWDAVKAEARVRASGDSSAGGRE